MDNAIRMSVLVEFTAGTSIEQAIGEALEFSRKNNCFVEFEFNGITMNVCALSGIDHREADIAIYKKLYNSMLELRERKEQKERNKEWKQYLKEVR